MVNKTVLGWVSQSKWWSLSVEVLLSTGPTPSSLITGNPMVCVQLEIRGHVSHGKFNVPLDIQLYVSPGKSNVLMEIQWHVSHGISNNPLEIQRHGPCKFQWSIGNPRRHWKINRVPHWIFNDCWKPNLWKLGGIFKRCSIFMSAELQMNSLYIRLPTKKHEKSKKLSSFLSLVRQLQM